MDVRSAALQKCNTLGKVFFFAEFKYTGKVIWDLCEKAPFPAKRAAAKLDTETGHNYVTFHENRVTISCVSCRFYSDIDTAAALTDKTPLKEADSLVFFFTLPKYHIIYAVEK